MSALVRTPNSSREGSVSQGSPSFANVSDRSPALKTPRPASDTRTPTKEVKELRSQADVLGKENARLQRRLESAVAELGKIRSVYEAREKEATVLKTTLHKVGKQKQDTERELVESKKYSRRLESSLATASKSSLASEVSTLQTQLSTLQAQCSQSKSDLEALGKSLSSAAAENQRLQQALEVKAEDFGLVGDLRAQLLYEVAESRKERERAERSVKPLEADIALLRKQLEGAYTTIEELKLVREANNEEMIRLEGNLHSETEVRVDLEAELERALEEKARLLALVDELNRRPTPPCAVKTEHKAVLTDLDGTMGRLEREVRDRDETLRRQAALHKQEMEEIRTTLAGLETALLQAKAGSPPPPVPGVQVESQPGGETAPLRKSDLPTDHSRFSALIAEERKRTEELMRRYRPKP